MGKENTLVPELRFPEFQGLQDWNRLNGNKLFNQINDRDHNGDLPVLAITQEHGAIPRDMIDYNVSVSESSIKSYKIVRVGDFIISLRSFQGGIEFSNYEGLCSPAYVILKEKGDTVAAFFKHFFKSKAFIRELTKNLEGLRDGKMISYKQFSEVYINLPQKAEQQKIADCLGSLDDLIAAHSRKLDTLQDHKKGLLQQLFPAEGETIPKLRFPGFEGEWKEIRLNKLGKLIPGLTYSPEDIREDGLLVLRSSNVQDGNISLIDNVYVDPEVNRANLSQPNDILICVRNGSKSLIGKNALIPQGMPLCTHGAFMTVFRSDKPAFVFQLFQTPAYRKQVAADLGATINSINGAQFLKYKFRIPSIPEQQKIADCLIKLDALITAQTKHITALKEHKKGLMQQLFPYPA